MCKKIIWLIKGGGGKLFRAFINSELVLERGQGPKGGIRGSRGGIRGGRNGIRWGGG